MSFLPHQEPKRCRFLKSTFKEAVAACHGFCRKLSAENDDDVSDYDDEQEVFVSAVLSKYMETKSRRRFGLALDSFIWDFSMPEKSPPADTTDVEEKDEFRSVGSRLSRCSSATSAEMFVSARTNLSRCSSMSSIELPAVFRRRRSIIGELCHCEGWPFGLCRKALLIPPLPKSPSESWLWRKRTKTIKIP